MYERLRKYVFAFWLTLVEDIFDGVPRHIEDAAQERQVPVPGDPKGDTHDAHTDIEAAKQLREAIDVRRDIEEGTPGHDCVGMHAEDILPWR